MSRETIEVLDVSLDVLWGAVVVVSNGEASVERGMVYLAQADVHAKEELDEEEDEGMEFGSQKGSNAPLMAFGRMARRGGGSTIVHPGRCWGNRR